MVAGRVLSTAQIEHALDQPIVVQVAATVRVVATAEVQEQIAFRSVVAPGLVGHGAEDERPEPLGGLALANVDDPTVVHFNTAGPKRVLGSVEPAAHGEGKVGAGKQQAAIVLPQPLTLGTEIEVVPIGPEAMEKGSPRHWPCRLSNS